jgi:pyruvate dehydrogenase E2 component (dihydrolipoamide acetyltransferase)
MSKRFEPMKNVTAMRKIAAGMWRPPNDPHVFGEMDVDATAMLELLKKLNAEREQRLTVTHLIIRAVAMTLEAHPEVNVKVRWGRLLKRKHIDIFVQVALPNGDLSGTTLRDADRMDLDTIARELIAAAAKIRKGDDPAYQKSRDFFRTLPPFLVRPFLSLSSFLVNSLHLDLSSQGMPADLFGSAMVTSVGMVGVDKGFAPFTPIARCPMIITVNHIREMPWGVDGEICIRPILPLTATLDHRVIDGFHAGRLATTMRDLLAHPEKLLAKPAQEAASAEE